MPDPREVLAAALAEQSPDDDDLRDWLTDRAEFVEDALAAAGIHLCTEGQAVVDGQVVKLVLARVVARLGMESDCWMDGRSAYVTEALDA